MGKFPVLKSTYLIVSCLIAISSFGASIILIVFALYLGPKQIRNQYISFWLAVLLSFFSVQAIYILDKRKKNIINGYFFIDFVYYFLAACGGLVLIILYLKIPWRIEALVFSSLILAICASNCLSLIIKRNSKRKVANREQNPTIINNKYNNESLFCSILRYINIILKVIFLVILILILVGAGTTASGYVRYPARGNFSIISFNDTSGRQARIHFMCDGPQDDSQPVFIFDGSGTHTMADFYGLQSVMSEKGRRSCIFDFPGQGYSDNLYNDMSDLQIIYHNMISSFEESPPFIMVGWDTGGENVYKYARDHPEMVDSLVFLDVYPIDIEFKTPYVLKNWTESERDKFKYDTLGSRRFQLDLINSLAVPFGLMRLLTPIPDRYVPETNERNETEFTLDEIRWFNLTDRTWIAQRHWIRTMFDNEDTFEKYTIDQNIPIHVFSTYFTDGQVVNKTCIEQKKLDPNSEECKYEVAANRYQTSEKENLVLLTQGRGRIVRCTMDECNSNYWINAPQFTVEKLLEIYTKRSCL